MSVLKHYMKAGFSPAWYWQRILDKSIRRASPPWESFPAVIQIDTNNYCGPKYCKGELCKYCYPQREVLAGRDFHGEMRMSNIEWIFREIGRDGRRMFFVSTFLNGDGLTEPRQQEICRLSKKYAPWLPTETFTCGANYEDMDRLLIPELDRVNFTISAHTPELYKVVHGADNFDNAIRSLKKYLSWKKPGQICEVHCVLNKWNIPYVREWWSFFGREEFAGLTRVLSPLVASPSNEPSLMSMGDYTTRQITQIANEVTQGHGVFWDLEDRIKYHKPCVLWDNCSFSHDGTFLQCCNWYDPKIWNYGTIDQAITEGRSLGELWRERLANKMRNPVCRSCNMKSIHWQERLGKINAKIQRG